ncbi:hypothetical protein GOP47_0023153 [Adiantum capillus-veneris]|uniref:Cysteine proteinase inhibitor n=2 Tax=Adiantum capillus-veneris TaxID=13818 RepID=A0A9D4U6S8_ADICA|nr:hypothetical protein GOP47_0023153 [Adiantum capillus-veneris]
MDFGAARPWCLVLLIGMALFMQTMAQTGVKEKISNAQNSAQLQDLASFAVKQYNSKQGFQLQFVRLVSAEQQVVSGLMYYLVIEASSKGKSNYYEAKVLVQAWRNIKSLESFKQMKKSGSTDVETNV